MRNNDFVVRFAGEGGGGLVTSAELLAQVTSQVGYHVKTFVTFPSQIMGGPTFAQARISTEPVLSYGDQLDVLVALDREAYNTHQSEVREGGVIIYNSEDFQLEEDGTSQVWLMNQTYQMKVDGEEWGDVPGAQYQITRWFERKGNDLIAYAAKRGLTDGKMHRAMINVPDWFKNG